MLDLSRLFHAVVTGPRWRRRLLTPVGAAVFGGLVVAVLVASRTTDRVLGLPPLLPGPLAAAIGLTLLGAGLALWTWCVLLFRRAGGTPVPVNPPRALIAEGPYARVRNPMMSGVFMGLFGLGLSLHSVSMVLLWTPLFVAVAVAELKLVEEPELERRLGPPYAEYRSRVPMFLPRLRRHIR